MLCLDTNVLIDFWNQRSEVARYFEDVNELTLSYVVMGEFLQGARDRKEQQLFLHFLQHFRIHLGSQAVSRRALQLVEKHTLSHGLSLMDGLVAATALEMQVPLVTANRRHFLCVSGLEIIDPREESRLINQEG